MSASHAFKEWFPKNVTDNPERHLRRVNVYKEKFAKTERLRRAPLYSFRRILNSVEREDEVERFQDLRLNNFPFNLGD